MINPIGYEISAGKIVEAQTRQIEAEFKCSRPKPRNRAMGFKGEDNHKKSRSGFSVQTPKRIKGTFTI